jgi:hypothetical protein
VRAVGVYQFYKSFVCIFITRSLIAGTAGKPFAKHRTDREQARPCFIDRLPHRASKHVNPSAQDERAGSYPELADRSAGRTPWVPS